jgi:phosphomannomutase
MAKFSVSGLRGAIGADLTPVDFMQVANAYAVFLKERRLLCSRDARISGIMLEGATSAGLQAAGADVFSCGVITTPTSVYGTKVLGVGGGVVITASHNPANENGLKFLEKGRFLVPSRSEEFVQFVSKVEFLTHEPASCGGFEKADVKSLHKEALLKIFERDPFEPRLRVGLDPVNGAAGIEAKEILEVMNCEVYAVNFEPTGRFARGGEPVPENLNVLCTLVHEKNLDAGFAFDPDGDRLAFVDERGRAPGEEYTVPLCCEWALERRKGNLAVNLSTSRMIDSIVEKRGIKLLRTPVGEAHVVDGLLENCGVAGGEGNGGFIYPSFNSTRDGLLAMAVLIEILRTKGTLSEPVDSLPTYYMRKDKFKVEWSPGMVEKVRSLFPTAEMDTRDGLWLSEEDFWLHLRPSNTEPVVRIVLEAKTKEKGDKILTEVKKTCVE